MSLNHFNNNNYFKKNITTFKVVMFFAFISINNLNTAFADDIYRLKSTDYTDFLLETKTNKIIESEDIYTLKGDIGPIYMSTQKDFKDEDLISVYEVKDNETIEDIANLFNINKNTIVWANDLQNKKIKKGQVLLILPIDGVKYTIKNGDTLKNIAKKYKADLIEIKDYNYIEDESLLATGQEIIIPNAIIESTVSNTKSINNKKSNIAQNYTKNYTNSSGYFIRPIVGGIKTQGIHGKNAIDIGVPVNTPIRAAADGTVIVARGEGYNGGYGGLIIIKHNNGSQTVYAHLNSVSVNNGDTVTKGQNIGKSGNTGKSTGPHLHFEIRGATNPF